MQEVCAVFTAKRNKPRVHNDHTFREVTSFLNINERKLFSELCNSNSFMKFVVKITDEHFDNIMQVYHRCANCGAISLWTQIHQIFCIKDSVSIQSVIWQ